MESTGGDRDEVGLRVLVESHFDHVGWNTRPEGDRWVPTFPNARDLFSRTEYGHWMAEPGGYASNLPDTVMPPIIRCNGRNEVGGWVVTGKARWKHNPGACCATSTLTQEPS